MGRIERLCAVGGVRLTEQRRAIIRVLDESDDHPNVAELHRRVRAQDPTISLVTVYRAVKRLRDAKILEQRHFGDGSTRYERASRSHHDHLIDMTSGRVFEFRNDAIERLQRQVAEKMGYRLVDHNLELFAVPLASKPPRKSPRGGDKA